MPEFSYQALASNGQRSNGTLTAISEREVLSMLDARGLYPVHVAPLKSVSIIRGSRRRVRPRYTCVFFSQLADLLTSGVPLLRSLDILERQTSVAALREVLRDVRARVADGTGLAEAMAQHPRAFNELAVSMVRAGQEGGFLEDVLKRIADFTEHQEDLKARVIGAMAYPMFLAIFGSAILFVLVIFFVPQFDPIFDKLREKDQLPWLTSALINTSNFLIRFWWLVLGSLGGLIILFIGWAKTPGGRYTIDSWRLRLPSVGKIYLHLAISRFARILGTLLHNGIPILRALDIAKDSTGNRVLTQAITKAGDNVTAGNSLAAPLSACKYFPRDVVEMVAVGEESNQLEKVLMDISNALEKRTSRQLDLFVRLLEPVMLLVMAGVTLAVVMALLLPVFKMSSAIQ